MAENYGIEISFARWMMVGVPLSFIMLPIAWLLLTRCLFRFDVTESEAMRISGVTDAGIVLAAALILFVLPSGDAKNPRLMTWEYITRLPLGVLILFGGGLSLAASVSGSGLALWLGEQLAPLNVWGIAALVVASVALVIFLTELTSNLATTATLLPVMGAIAVQAGLPPIILTVPITIAASCAFMLPVATPPNAIVFSTGDISIPQMARAGIAVLSQTFIGMKTSYSPGAIIL